MHWIALVLLAIVPGIRPVADGVRSTSSQAATEDDAEVRRLRTKVQAFVDACDRGDAGSAAAHYTEDAEVVDSNGNVTRGRDALQKQLQAFFAKQKGARFDLTCDAAREITPNLIISRGSMTLTAPAIPRIHTQYTAVLSKRDDQWLIEHLCQTRVPPSSTRDGALQELEFLVGEWVEVDGDAVIHSVAEWTRGNKLIFRTFAIHLKDGSGKQGTEVIAWDPVIKAIRSWIFESDGAFGERAWTKEGSQWIIKCTAILPNGRTISSVDTIRRIDANRIGWQSTARSSTGREPLNAAEIILLRKQPSS